MPFEIVRNDITLMQVDAIVNSVSTHPVIGTGVDLGIHQKAGPELFQARAKLGELMEGEAVITPGFLLPAKHVIHVVCPLWEGGWQEEEPRLRVCIRRSLDLAAKQGLHSIAFPLLGSGNLNFPKGIALENLVRVFQQFLARHDMQIYLTVLDQESCRVSGALIQNIVSYIDANYAEEVLDKESCFAGFPLAQAFRRNDHPTSPRPSAPRSSFSLSDLLKKRDAGFSETLVSYIEKRGLKNSEVYKKANVDKKLFSKIINNVNYHPSKQTALAFAIALELNLEETLDLIKRAGFTLSHSSKFDIIIEYFLIQGCYDLFEINEVLYRFDQPLLGI